MKKKNISQPLTMQNKLTEQNNDDAKSEKNLDAISGNFQFLTQNF